MKRKTLGRKTFLDFKFSFISLKTKPGITFEPSLCLVVYLLVVICFLCKHNSAVYFAVHHEWQMLDVAHSHLTDWTFAVISCLTGHHHCALDKSLGTLIICYLILSMLASTWWLTFECCVDWLSFSCSHPDFHDQHQRVWSQKNAAMYSGNYLL